MSHNENEIYLKSFIASVSSAESVTKPISRLFETLLMRYFKLCVGDDLSPWRTIEGLCLRFVLRLPLGYARDMELYLALHLLGACKMRMCDNDQQRVTFVGDLLNWLPNIQFTEENEVYLLLLWSQAVCWVVNLHLMGKGTACLDKALT